MSSYRISIEKDFGLEAQRKSINGTRRLDDMSIDDKTSTEASSKAIVIDFNI